MFGFIKKLFGNNDTATHEQAQAPYKVEAPVVETVVAAPVVETVVAAPVAEPVVETAPAPVAEAAPQRAKDTKGKFVADNPATPENEAWKGGKAPAAIKAAPKKAAAKKPAAKKPAAKKPGVKKSAA
jgi:hypothetical protein